MDPREVRFAPPSALSRLSQEENLPENPPPPNRVHLNKCLRTISVGFLTHVTGKKGKSPHELFEKVHLNAFFVQFWGFRVVFGRLDLDGIVMYVLVLCKDRGENMYNHLPHFQPQGGRMSETPTYFAKGTAVHLCTTICSEFVHISDLIQLFLERHDSCSLSFVQVFVADKPRDCQTIWQVLQRNNCEKGYASR